MFILSRKGECGMLNHPSSSLGSDRKMTASPPPRSRDTHTHITHNLLNLC